MPIATREIGGISEKHKLLFWSKVDKTTTPDGCWEWTATKNLQGYGHVTINRRVWRAHRVAFVMEYGEPLNDLLFICHKCDNTSCVRPSHLFCGTHEENMRDRELKGRNNISSALEFINSHPELKARGERNGLAKLTEHSVRKMRILHATNKCEIKDIAKLFNVHYSTAERAIKGLTWQHVA